MRGKLPVLLGVALGAAGAAPARAYEGPTTLAGLTERAALGSRLHRRLLDRFGADQGLLEPLRLDPKALPKERAQELESRLRALDPAEGYAPEALPGALSPPVRRQSAIGWLAAGAVLETVPEARLANHFLDAEGKGLRRPPGQTAAAASLRALGQGLSTFRELVTGSGFDGQGLASTDWLRSPDNDLGLPVFLRACEQAVVAEAPEARETALAEMLLSAGAALALLEQAGDPAYVRNDAGALLRLGGPYEHYVARRFGRAGVPEPDKALPGEAPRHLGELFFNAAGTGLAQRTARRFFSPGTLPGSGAPLPLSAAPLLGEVPAVGAPRTPAPAGWPEKEGGYLGTAAVPHLAAWTRGAVGQRPVLRWALDDRCHEDYARRLLPEVGRYAAAALDFLLRGDLLVELGEGGAPRARALGAALRGGTVALLGEDEGGRRRRLAEAPVKELEPGAALPLPELAGERLKGLRRLVVFYSGADDAGEPLLLSAQVALPAPAR